MKQMSLVLSLVMLASAYAENSGSVMAECSVKMGVTDKNPKNPLSDKWPVTEYQQSVQVELKGSEEIKEGAVTLKLSFPYYSTKLNLMHFTGKGRGRVKESLGIWIMTYQDTDGGNRLVAVQNSKVARERVGGKLLTSVEQINYDLINTIVKLGYSPEAALNLVADGTDTFQKLVQDGKVPEKLLYYQHIVCSLK